MQRAIPRSAGGLTTLLLAALAAASACTGRVIGPPVDGGGDSSVECSPACGSGEFCVDGRCVTRCSSSDQCSGLLECCDGGCVNVREDPHNCGRCESDCAPRGDGCQGGVCACNGAVACLAPLICCGDDGCVDPQTDARHCGGCDEPCDGSCVGGSCEECAEDANEAEGGDACAAAIDLGPLSDAGESQSVTGNLYPAGDRDCYEVQAQDTADTNCDAFHVTVNLVENPDSQFSLEVYRGSCEAPECPGEAYAMYEWFADTREERDREFVGECPCTPEPTDGANLCADDTAVFRFCVVRSGGDATSCDTYEVEVSNGPAS